jgi:hypothetical protein
MPHIHPEHAYGENEHYIVEEDLVALHRELSIIVKDKTGYKAQAKAKLIVEAVENIKVDTTIDDLKALSWAYEDKWGIRVVQIHIHKDEGHNEPKTGEWIPNRHAHLIFDYVNHKTGKTIKFNKQDMSEMQTIASEILKMARGESSDLKHLNAIQYKNKAEQDYQNELHEQIAIDEGQIVTELELIESISQQIVTNEEKLTKLQEEVEFRQEGLDLIEQKFQRQQNHLDDIKEQIVKQQNQLDDTKAQIDLIENETNMKLTPVVIYGRKLSWLERFHLAIGNSVFLENLRIKTNDIRSLWVIWDRLKRTSSFFFKDPISDEKRKENVRVVSRATPFRQTGHHL